MGYHAKAGFEVSETLLCRLDSSYAGREKQQLHISSPSVLQSLGCGSSICSEFLLTVPDGKLVSIPLTYATYFVDTYERA